MAGLDELGINPYYDRYVNNGKHSESGYTRLLAIPGVAEQSAEFNEIQSIQRDYLERLGNAVLRDGYIISGCELNISDNVVTIGSGRIFLEGLVRIVPEEVTLAISGIGTEKITAYIKSDIVTENEDETLRDPAQGAENYGLAGAHRERQVVKWEVISGDDMSSNNGATVYTLEAGNLIVGTESNNEYTFLTDTLAERTFDSDGNFKVYGISLKDGIEENTDEDMLQIEVSDGKAYVKGYEVIKEYSSNILLNKAVGTRSVQSESRIYRTVVNDRDGFALSNSPVDTVTNVTALVTVDYERLTKSSVGGGYQNLNHFPVDSIKRVVVPTVKGGAPSDRTKVTITVNGVSVEGYVLEGNGVDYDLYGDQIDWTSSGYEPAANTSYYVSYVYNKSMQEGVDFEIENRASNRTSYIKFIGSGASGNELPDSNSRFYISYTYTLSRRDLLILDSSGRISVIEGKPDRLQYLITPYNGSKDYIELGYVDIYPTDSRSGNPAFSVWGRVVNYPEIRFTQGNIYSLYERILKLEDDMTSLNLDREVTEGEDLQTLKGYLVDNFTSLEKIDEGYSRNENGKQIVHNASIDVENAEMTTYCDMTPFAMEMADSSIGYVKHNRILKDDNGNNYVDSNVISPAFSLRNFLTQVYATGTMLVNPYAAYGPMCQVQLSPDRDTWTDTTRLSAVVNQGTTVSYSYRTVSSTTWRPGGERYGTFVSSRDIGSTTSYSGSSVSHNYVTTSSTSYIEYMRSRTVTVTGNAFAAGSKCKNGVGVYCKFAGRLVSLSSINTGLYRHGNPYGGVQTVIPDENGSFVARFTVPSGVRCGKVSVILTQETSDGEICIGQAAYESVGTKLTITTTDYQRTTSYYTVTRTVLNTYSSDPLAQSFIVSKTENAWLKRIGVYFASKSNSRPIVVQVRNMVNGYPGETVYAETSLKSADVKAPVKTGEDAVASNPNQYGITYIDLPVPVHCEANTPYCFCLLSDSNLYSVFVANMGEKLITNSSQVMSSNPYEAGVLFSSSNSQTWTAHQGSDMKFELHRCNFTTDAVILFKDVVKYSETNPSITVKDITGIYLDASFEDSDNDGIEWEYQYRIDLSTWSEWLPIQPLVFRELNAVTDAVRVRVRLRHNSNGCTAAFLDLSSCTLRTVTDADDSIYITKAMTEDDFDEPYNSLKISYKQKLPSGSSVALYYTMGSRGAQGNIGEYDDAVWHEVSANDSGTTLSIKNIDEEWEQVTWEINNLYLKNQGNSTAYGYNGKGNFFRLRMDLKTELKYNKPAIAQLSTIFRSEL